MLLLVAVLSACATTGGDPRDPLEPLNRAVFRFNDAIDEAVFQPVARGYRAALPQLVRTGVTNFFSNLEDLWIGANNVLQGKVSDGIQDFARFTFNSTFGLLGLIDVSTDFNIPKHNEDFGQTLGRWGVGSGPYLVLPFFGPSTVRDGLGLFIDSRTDFVVNLDEVAARNTLYANRVVNTRANLLDATRVLGEAALDKYRFVRDAYLQRRRSLIYDGSPPFEDEGEDEDEGPEPPTPQARVPGNTFVPGPENRQSGAVANDQSPAGAPVSLSFH
jgi:phospholipid-binding lipoprotein MlaA